MHAIGNNPLLEVLLEHKNIDLELANIFGNNAMLHCVKNSDECDLNLLLTYANKNYTIEKVKNMLNKKNLFLESPLIVAVKSSIRIVNMLLDTQLMDVNIVNSNGKTPLLLAIESENIAIVKLLLETKDVDLNTKDKFGNSAIMKLISSNDYDTIFKFLGNQNVDLSCKDSIEKTPLIQAIMLKYGKRTTYSKSDNTWDGAFNTVKMAEFPNCFEESMTNINKVDVFNRANKVNAPINSKFGNDSIYDIIVCKLLNTEGSNVNVSDMQGNTPFCLICENSDIFLFDILLSNPTFDPHFKNKKGMSSYNWIKTKYEALVCNLFGSNNYCPLETCCTHPNAYSELDTDARSVGSLGTEGTESSYYKVNNEDVLDETLDETLDDNSNAFGDLFNIFKSAAKEIAPGPKNKDKKCSTGVPKCSKSFATTEKDTFDNFDMQNVILSRKQKSSYNFMEKPVNISDSSLQNFNVVKYFYEKTKELVMQKKNII
jgi:ankyrin repeat protein